LQSKQYSVKVFECSVDNEDEFIDFFETNYTLFKDHLIVINGEISNRIKEYLNSKALIFANNLRLPKGRTRRALEEEILAEMRECNLEKHLAQMEIEKLSNRLQNNLRVYDEIIRSGRELNIDGDLLLLNRVNSGANIYVSGNFIATKLVEGFVWCNGNFMILSASPKATIIFKGVELDNNYLKGRLNRVEYKNQEIVITPVFEKEMIWA
jgi:septum site-determining protein MinC